MKEPEMLQAIVIHHCLYYQIIFQIIQKKIKIHHIHIHSCGKVW